MTYKIQVVDSPSGDWKDECFNFPSEQEAKDYVFALRMMIGNMGKQYRVVLA